MVPSASQALLGEGPGSFVFRLGEGPGLMCIQARACIYHPASNLCMKPKWAFQLRCNVTWSAFIMIIFNMFLGVNDVYRHIPCSTPE